MEHFTVATQGQVRVITIARPKQGNALRLEMYPALVALLDEAAKDRAVRAVVLTGAGSFFSVGADVQQAAESFMGGESLDGILKRVMEGPIKLTQALIEFPKVAVAAVNGQAVGYAAGLLGLFDTVYVAEKGSVALPFMQLGLAPEGCSSYTYPRIVGEATFQEMLRSGRTVKAAEMVARGLAAEQLPAADFAAAVVAKVAAQLEGCSGKSLRSGKQLVRGPNVAAMTAANDEEAKALKRAFESGEPMTRFAAVQEKLQQKRSSKL